MVFTIKKEEYMEFKVEFEEILKNVYDVYLDDVDGEIDDYYYGKISFKEVNASEELCSRVDEYIKEYSFRMEIHLEIKDIQDVSNRVLAFAINNKSSDMHYNKFVSAYKDKIITDFIKAEKVLYETEYLVKSGVYEDTYSFDLNVNAIESCIEFKDELDALDALVMVCQGDYDVTELSEFRDDFGNTHKERFIGGMDALKNFETIFDTQEGIFKPEDLSYLYGQCDIYDTDVEYEVFENWMGTIEAVEIFGF